MTAIAAQAAYVILAGLLAFKIGQRLQRHGDGLATQMPPGRPAMLSLTRMVLLGFHLVAVGTAVLLMQFGTMPASAVNSLTLVATRIAALVLVLGIVQFHCLSILVRAHRHLETRDRAARRPPRQGREDPLDRVIEAVGLDTPSGI